MIRFLGQYTEFSNSFTKNMIRENDRSLTNVNGKKVNLSHLGLMSALGAYGGYESGKLGNMLKTKKNIAGKGLKAKVIGTALGTGLTGGLSYYLQTRDRDGRSDKGKKRINK